MKDFQCPNQTNAGPSILLNRRWSSRT